jgi:3-deoxy-7-phosphoheptulonate synthase
MIDCSHGNSEKDHRRQAVVAASIAEQVAAGSKHIFGVMLESHLVEGRQDYKPREPSVYGQSVTDACISIEQTEPLLEQLARAQKTRAATSASETRRHACRQGGRSRVHSAWAHSFGWRGVV